MSRQPSFSVADGMLWLTGRYPDHFDGRYGFSKWSDTGVSVGPFTVSRIDRVYGAHKVTSLSGGFTAKGAQTKLKQAGATTIGAGAKVFFALATGNNALHIPEFHIVGEASVEIKLAHFFAKIEAFTQSKAPALLEFAGGALKNGLIHLNNLFDVGIEFKGGLGISVGFTQGSDGMHHGWVRFSTVMQAELKLFGKDDRLQNIMNSAEIATGTSPPKGKLGGGRAWQIRMVDVPYLRMR